MASFSASIIASADDADQSGSAVDITSATANANNTTQWVGLRFTNVTIPPGSTITAATLEVEIVTTSFDSPDVSIYGHNTDAAPAFTTSSNDISGRTSTTATVTWTATDIGIGIKSAPDLKTIIQEIINRPGWASGNDIALIYTGRSSSSYLRIRTYNAGSGTPAKLTITYDSSSPVTVNLSTLSRTLSAVALSIVPGAVAVSAKTINGGLSPVALGVVPGSVVLELDTLSLLSQLLQLTVGQSVSLNTLSGGATVGSLTVVPGAAAVLLAALAHAFSVEGLTVVPGPVTVEAATLAAVLEAVALDVSTIGADVTVLMQAITGALSPVEIGVIPGDMVISLQTFESSLSLEKLLVFMILGCVMLGDRANYGATAGDFRRYLVAVDDRGGCCE